MGEGLIRLTGGFDALERYVIGNMLGDLLPDGALLMTTGVDRDVLVLADAMADRGAETAVQCLKKEFKRFEQAPMLSAASRVGTLEELPLLFRQVQELLGLNMDAGAEGLLRPGRTAFLPETVGEVFDFDALRQAAGYEALVQELALSFLKMEAKGFGLRQQQQLCALAWKLLFADKPAPSATLADLSSYSSDGTLDTSTIDGALLGSGTIDGKLVGIPLASTLLAFIYNPSVLEEAGVEPPRNGWTWDDFKSICLTVKETTGKYGFGGSTFIDTNLLNYWVRQYGVPLFAADNKSLGFDDQQILTDYFQLWKDLIDAGAAPNPDEYEQIATLGNEASPVITGDAAFHQSWDNFANIGANAGNDTLELLVPPVKEAGQAALWYKPGMFFSVAETSEVKEECAKFIDWFVNSDEANDIIMGERGTPASSSARDYLVGSGKLSGKQAEMFQLCHRGRRLLRPNPRPRSHRHL